MRATATMSVPIDTTMLYLVASHCVTQWRVLAPQALHLAGRLKQCPALQRPVTQMNGQRRPEQLLGDALHFRLVQMARAQRQQALARIAVSSRSQVVRPYQASLRIQHIAHRRLKGLATFGLTREIDAIPQLFQQRQLKTPQDNLNIRAAGQLRQRLCIQFIEARLGIALVQQAVENFIEIQGAVKTMPLQEERWPDRLPVSQRFQVAAPYPPDGQQAERAWKPAAATAARPCPRHRTHPTRIRRKEIDQPAGLPKGADMQNKSRGAIHGGTRSEERRVGKEGRPRRPRARRGVK